MERAAQLRRAGRELIVLAQAMVDYAPPRTFLEALDEGLREPGGRLHGYAPDPGLPELRAALRGYLEASFGLAVDPQTELLVTPGANHAAYTAFATLLEPGDEAILITPWYFNHEMSLRLLDVTPKLVTAAPEDGFVPSLEALEAAWTPRTRLLTLVTPNNPTGARYSDDWLRALARLLADSPRWRAVTLLVDQTYQELHYTAPAPLSPAALDGLPERTITVGSFSKCFALAGWRLGFLAAPAGLVAEALKIQDSTVICAPHAAQWALARTLEAGVETGRYLEEKRRLLRGRRDALLAPFAEAGRPLPLTPAGACFAFLPLPAGCDGERVAGILLEEDGVVTVPGIHFGPGWGRYLRLSFGTEPEARLREAGRRICGRLASMGGG
jgi:aspartate/methionine/tyrosine aminotransferase